MSLKIIIADDEPAAVDVIRGLIEHLAPDLTSIHVCNNGLHALKNIIEIKPDLVFLDVDMPMMNGLEVIEKLPFRSFELIFTTGSAEYALQALKSEAIDYLVKPLDPADFLLAINKARQRLALKKLKPDEHERIQFTTQTGIIYLEEKKIMQVEGKGSYSVVITTEGEKIIISKNIGEVSKKLSETTFFRCHNSYIVNMDYISQFSTKDGYRIIMNNKSEALVSRRSKDALISKLNERSR